jgi:hypothetical protein
VPSTDKSLDRFANALDSLVDPNSQCPTTGISKINGLQLGLMGLSIVATVPYGCVYTFLSDWSWWGSKLFYLRSLFWEEGGYYEYIKSVFGRRFGL